MNKRKITAQYVDYINGLEQPDEGEWVCVRKYFTKHTMPDKKSE